MDEDRNFITVAQTAAKIFVRLLRKSLLLE